MIRFLMIEEDLNVKEMTVNPDDIFNENVLDTIRFDERHDLWFPDDVMGMVNGYVEIDGNHLPLPVYIAGFEGEETISAVLTVDEVKSKIR